MYRDILLPIDLNHASAWEKPLPIAVEYCKAFGAKLHILYVVPDFGRAVVGSFFPDGFEEKALASAQDELHEFVSANVPSDIDVQIIIGNGSVYDEILRVAREISADLIVIHAHRPELKDYLLGPNAARVVRHYAGSVLVVR